MVNRHEYTRKYQIYTNCKGQGICRSVSEMNMETVFWICLYYCYTDIWVRFMVLSATFNNISVILIVAVSFIGWGNWSTQRKPPTCRKSLTNFITYSIMTSFFRFVNNRASYPFGKISLAHTPVNATDFSIGSIHCVRHFLQT
jgi:hypothetical protein